MTVHPHEEARVLGVCDTVRNPVGPVLCDTLLRGQSLQSGRRHRQLHVDANVTVPPMVIPQHGGGFVRTSFSLHQRRLHVAQVLHPIRPLSVGDVKLLALAEEIHFVAVVEYYIQQQMTRSVFREAVFFVKYRLLDGRDSDNISQRLAEGIN